MKMLINNKRTVALFLLLIYSASISAFARSTAYSFSRKQFTGQELFEAIFFAKGPAASELPEIQKLFADKLVTLNASQTAELLKKEELLTTEIKKKFPTAFEDLKKNIQTHNYAVVQAALEDMANKIIDVTYQNNDQGLSREDYIRNLKEGRLKPGNSDCVTVYFFVNIAVAAEIVIAVLGVLVAAAEAPNKKTDLQKEYIVNAVVTHLAGI